MRTTQHAVTVLGRDRPGIIARATERLTGLGLNLEDSTMTLLRGHFAMMLVCSGEASDAEIAAALAPLETDGLVVHVGEVPVEEPPAEQGAGWVLTVHGADHPGIVAAVTAPVAAAGGNITDLSTRLSGDFYVLVAEVVLPTAADVAALQDDLRAAAQRAGVEVSWREVEADDL